MGQAFSIHYVPVPENTTLLDVLNIAWRTHGLTASLRRSKSNRLVNAAAENSPIRASPSYSSFLFLFFPLSLLAFLLLFFLLSWMFFKVRENETEIKYAQSNS